MNLFYDFTTSAIGVYCYIFFYSIFLRKKVNFKKNLAIVILLNIIGYVLCIVFPQHIDWELIDIIFMFIFFTLFSDKFTFKIFALVFTYSLSYITEMLLYSINYTFLSEVLLNVDRRIVGIYVALIELFVFIMIGIILEKQHKENSYKYSTLSFSQIFSLLPLPLLSAVLVSTLEKAMISSHFSDVQVAVYMCFVCAASIIYDVVCLSFIQNSIINKEIIHQNEIIAMELATQCEHYQNIISLTEETRKVKHDFKNYLVTLSSLIESRELDNAKKLIADIDRTVKNLSFNINSGNKIVDAILNEKFDYAKRGGITEHCRLSFL